MTTTFSINKPIQKAFGLGETVKMYTKVAAGDILTLRSRQRVSGSTGHEPASAAVFHFIRLDLLCSHKTSQNMNSEDYSLFRRRFMDQ